MLYRALLSLSMSCLLCCESPWAEDQAEFPRATWETVIQSQDLEFELKGSAISPSGSNIGLILGLRPKGTISGFQDIKLQMLDADGKPKFSIDLNAYGKQMHPHIQVHLGGLVVTDDQWVFAAFVKQEGKVQLVGVDVAAGVVKLDKILALSYPNVDVSGLLLTSRGTFLLFGGTRGSKGFVAELDRNGVINWQAIVDKPVSMLLDAVELQNGYGLVGGSGYNGVGDIRNFGGVWIGEIGANGQLLRGRSVPGPSRFINIAKAADGHLAIVFDQLHGGAYSETATVQVQGLKADLEESWQQALVSEQPITAPFQISWIGTSEFWVVGVKDRGALWQSKITGSGKAAWTYTSAPVAPDYPRFHSAEIARSTKHVLVSAGLSTVTDRRQQQIVKVALYADQ